MRNECAPYSFPRLPLVIQAAINKTISKKTGIKIVLTCR